jgi:hypothetical protein
MHFLQKALNDLLRVYYTPEKIIQKIKIDSITGNPPFNQNDK